MWSSKILLIIALLVVAFVCGNEEEEEELTNLIQLDDNTFEHLTQASTGATTGDWLVLMTKDKKCLDCEKIEKELMKVATLQKGRMNVAKLVTKESRLTLRRFGIPKKPTLLFFRLGMQWKYKGDMKKKKINEFITEGFARQSAHRVLPQLDSIDVWKEDFLKELKAAYKEKRLPERNVLVILLIALLAAFMFILGFASSKDKDTKKKKD